MGHCSPNSIIVQHFYHSTSIQLLNMTLDRSRGHLRARDLGFPKLEAYLWQLNDTKACLEITLWRCFDNLAGPEWTRRLSSGPRLTSRRSYGRSFVPGSLAI